MSIDKVVGIDARGFIFAAAVADRLGVGFVPIRKQGKLPWKTRGLSYTLEYGENVVEIHEDAVKPGEKILLVDDLLATGGTAAAAVELLDGLGADRRGGVCDRAQLSRWQRKAWHTPDGVTSRLSRAVITKTYDPETIQREFGKIR